MKYNKQLTEIVPPEIRLEVYKKALNLIENWKHGEEEEKQRFLPFPELCILLPTLLYEQKHWRNKDITWFHSESKISFPELNNGFLSEIYVFHEQLKITPIRIKYLKIWIKELEEIQNKSENQSNQ